MKSFLVVGLCLAGIAVAQQPPPGPGRPGPRGGFGPGGFGGMMSERRLTSQLNLNATQQNAVHTAIEEARVVLQGVDAQESALRTQLATAVKAGDEASIDRISQNLAGFHQQRTSVQAKAMAKIYATLSADQKSQIDRELNRSLGVPGPRGPRVQRQAAPAPQQ